MTIEQAIRKAIEAGWKLKPHEHIVPRMTADPQYALDCIYTDPLFWQALGKTMGWANNFDKKGGWRIYPTPNWESEWYSFIDILAQGKTAEQFFYSLTPPQ